MYCSKCGSKIEGTAKFCSNCGNKLMSIDNNVLKQNLTQAFNMKFEQLMLVIATIVYPLALLFLPSFVELYRYIPHAGEWRYGDVFLLIQETNKGWDGLSTVVTTILIIMVAFSVTTIFCSFGERKKHIVVPSIVNGVLLIALYVSAEIVSCADGHSGHYVVIPHIGYILAIISIVLTLVFSIKIYSEHKKV